MSEQNRPGTNVRTLTEHERFELVQLIAGGQWRVLGSPQGE